MSPSPHLCTCVRDGQPAPGLCQPKDTAPMSGQCVLLWVGTGSSGCACGTEAWQAPWMDGWMDGTMLSSTCLCHTPWMDGTMLSGTCLCHTPWMDGTKLASTCPCHAPFPVHHQFGWHEAGMSFSCTCSRISSALLAHKTCLPVHSACAPACSSM